MSRHTSFLLLARAKAGSFIAIAAIGKKNCLWQIIESPELYGLIEILAVKYNGSELKNTATLFNKKLKLKINFEFMIFIVKLNEKKKRRENMSKKIDFLFSILKSVNKDRPDVALPTPMQNVLSRLAQFHCHANFLVFN